MVPPAEGAQTVAEVVVSAPFLGRKEAYLGNKSRTRCDTTKVPHCTCMLASSPRPSVVAAAAAASVLVVVLAVASAIVVAAAFVVAAVALAVFVVVVVALSSGCSEPASATGEQMLP